MSKIYSALVSKTFTVKILASSQEEVEKILPENINKLLIEHGNKQMWEGFVCDVEAKDYDYILEDGKLKLKDDLNKNNKQLELPFNKILKSELEHAKQASKNIPDWKKKALENAKHIEAKLGYINLEDKEGK